jgi:hypothetical protein
MDEEKRLITYFSQSELHTIGTTVELKIYPINKLLISSHILFLVPNFFQTALNN